ncbi:MAG: VWA domain-containing protein [Verrucomicrobiae bacterium]|nr:VWA domain-containing protein [Verrucomicrobiae bacterium]
MGFGMTRKAVGTYVDNSSIFYRDQHGAIAIITGLIAAVILGFTALAIDIGFVLAVKSKLQSAVDAAALAGDPGGSKDDPEIDATVKAFFATNADKAFNAVSVSTSWSRLDDGLSVTAVGTVPMSFARIFGYNQQPVTVSANSRNAFNTEVALVLDNTNSMAGAKMESLKEAAKEMVTQMFKETATDRLKIGIVPFSNYVNVGKQYRSAMWLSVPNDSSTTTNQCSMEQKWKNCTSKTSTCFNDGLPFSCAQWTCEPDGPPENKCRDVTQTSVWNGCVGSRAAPDLDATASASKPIPGIMNVNCPRPLMRLTKTEGDVKAEIDNLVTQGETYIASGLMWGWRLMSTDAPFSDGATATSRPKTKKVLVLMTDGSNTKSQSGSSHEGGNRSDADKTLSDLCTAVKAESIVIYTVAFEVSDAAIKTRLTDCATAPKNFYDATDKIELVKSFTAIASSLKQVVLSK